MWTRRGKPPIASPKIVMTLLVRDEADVIDLFVRHHIRLGIDALIVTDNGSVDGTRDILQQHLKDGAIAQLFDEPAGVFDQSSFVDRMVRHAIDHHAADYCINSDADEFWRPPGGSFRTVLASSRSNKIYCPSFYMLPAADQPFWNSTDRSVRRADPKIYGQRPLYDLFRGPLSKAIHRTQGYRRVEAGNHGVAMDDDFSGLGSRLGLKPNRDRYSDWSKDIWLYHYSLRSLAQFKNKIIQGGASIEASKNDSERVGSHWRYLYRGYRDGSLDLEEEFHRIAGAGLMARFRHDGVVVTDGTMKDSLEPLARRDGGLTA